MPKDTRRPAFRIYARQDKRTGLAAMAQTPRQALDVCAALNAAPRTRVTAVHCVRLSATGRPAGWTDITGSLPRHITEATR